MKMIDAARSRRDLFRRAWKYLEAKGTVDAWGGAECQRVWMEYMLVQQDLALGFIASAANRPPPREADDNPSSSIV